MASGLQGKLCSPSAQESVEKGRATVGKADFPDTELNTALYPCPWPWEVVLGRWPLVFPTDR